MPQIGNQTRAPTVGFDLSGFVVFYWDSLSIGSGLTFAGNVNVKFRFLLSALIAAFLVVGTPAHGATHDYAPEVGQELVDCQGCHVQSSEAKEPDLEYFFSTQTPYFSTSAQALRPNSFGHYQSRAPPKF